MANNKVHTKPSFYIKTILPFIIFFILVSFLTTVCPGQSSENKSSNQLISTDANYIICVLESGADWDYKRLVDTLGINLWHRYASQNFGWVTVHNQWKQFDGLNETYEDYGEKIKNVVRANKLNGMQTLMDRNKINYLCYGQQSDYQCESEEFYRLNNPYPDYWFYTYSSSETGTDIIDTSSFGRNAKVKYCSVGPVKNNKQGYIVKNLKANREQINCSGEWSEYAGDRNTKWFIKPKIRIEQNYANDPANSEDPVCRIEITDFSGKIIKSINLAVRNFLNERPYDGNYMEEFFNLPEPESLTLNSRDNPHEKLNPGCNFIWDTTCQVDFRIYWYGKCDMWIDYIRVENEIANGLFKNEYSQWLEWEVKNIALSVENENPGSIFKFYIEEFEFNQIPCMEYVNKKIDSISDGKFSLMCDLNYSTFKIHTPSYQTFIADAEYIKRTLVEKIGLKEIFTGSYPILGEGSEIKQSFIPNTLPHHTLNYAEGILGREYQPEYYDTWLNNHFDDNRNAWYDFIHYLKRADSISKLCNIPFINLVQTHLWNSSGHKLREPTNEEIKLMVNLGISFGAKGLIYFHMNGFGKIGDPIYNRGLGNVNSSNNYAEPRYINVYGQEKWKNVCEINKRVKKWSSYLSKFTISGTRSYNYRYEKNDLGKATFINEISTFIPLVGAGDDYSELSPEKTENMFVQAAVFEDPNKSHTKFFMIINRRCSPYIDNSSKDNTGGKRIISVRLETSELHVARGYNLINIEDNTLVKSFRNNSNMEINLGAFDPGEGKIYKLEPVMNKTEYK